MNDVSVDLDRFYSLLSRIRGLGGQGMPLESYSGKSAFPMRGVYFFQEPGEFRAHDPSVPRIVRVGTHAVSCGSKATLWKRLKTHLGTRRGGGNHRGSIFRLHVGAALLAREAKVIPSWAVGSSISKAVDQDEVLRAEENAWEKKVTEHIGSMTVLWLNIPDEPGPGSKRAFIERNAIALLSNQLEPIDRANPGWLGFDSPRCEIQRSCLWNLKHVSETYDPQFLDHMEVAVEQSEQQVG